MMVDDRRGEGRFWATVALAAVLLGFVVLRDPTPSPAGANAPADTFSAARARAALERVLGDSGPHPMGSAAAERVRERVLSELRGVGLEPRVEESLVCNDYGTCGLVRNVVAEIEGRNGGGAILLNAHYDSVAASTGASDDGAGVAALLETARALKTGPPPERTIRFLIDDGEEVGLLGAEAWIREHGPDETMAVLVLEARGSSGPALLFETNRENLPLIDAYARSVPSPSTSSVFFSIYERLPNRTNFTVFKRAGYTGAAVAFIEDPAHYHTPLNDLEHLSDRSLQHMGDLTLSMSRELASAGLGESAATASYFDLLGRTVVLWPESWNVWLAVVGLVLVAAAGFVAMRRERASAPQVLLGWIVATFLVAVSGGAGWGLWRLAAARAGGSDWIANAGWIIGVAWVVALALSSTPYALVRRPPSLLSIWVSVWLMHGILGVVVARLLPGAAYLFFIPAIVAGLTGLASMAGPRSDRNEGMLVVPFVTSVLLLAPIVDGLYVGLGLVALPGVGAFAALLLLPILVVSTEARRSAMLVMAGGVAVVVLLAGFLLTDVHSDDVPRAVNVAAIHDGEVSTVALLGVDGPVPEPLANAAEWSMQPAEIFRAPGAAEAPRVWSAPLGRHDVDGIDVGASTFAPGDGDGTLRLVARPVDETTVIRVVLPSGSRVEEIRYGGHTVSPGDAASTRSRITLWAVPADGFTLVAAVKPGGEVVVLEDRPELPAAVRSIADLRSNREVPIGPGDRSIVVSRIPVDELPGEEPMASGNGEDP